MGGKIPIANRICHSPPGGVSGRLGGQCPARYGVFP
jgi:hypothetical protein